MCISPRIPVFALATSALILAACGGSRSESTTDDPPEPVDLLVERVTSLQIDRTPGGAIVHAVGLPPTQGYWGARLEPIPDESPDDGTIAYRFIVEKPEEPAQNTARRTREISAARSISNLSLQGTDEIRVIGTENSLTRRP